MKQYVPNKYLVPIGLFFLSGNIILSQFVTMPDLLRGLLTGFGFALIIGGFIKHKKRPGTAR